LTRPFHRTLPAHLPEDKTVPIEVTPQSPGEYEFTCGMNMYKGKIIVR